MLEKLQSYGFLFIKRNMTNFNLLNQENFVTKISFEDIKLIGIRIPAEFKVRTLLSSITIIVTTV